MINPPDDVDYDGYQFAKCPHCGEYLDDCSCWDMAPEDAPPATEAAPQETDATVQIQESL